ncbi:glutaredoxin family protein [Cellulomonas sp. PhB143]|uniref:glutaredoxin family protein n=1 Tax=Cellulomonas sp. PhB143 TaxID=2485186 RepID=UPI000F97FC56|nr:glutaredoxin family protein [Cellulomonas sp. PhB143]ROS76681.1 glutaredoxin [Cellulomonas sp. PhB143]
MPDAVPRVILYTRPGCHLCEDARTVVGRVCADAGERWAEVDVDAAADPALRAEHGEHLPVAVVDGVQHAFWTVDQGRLARALARPRGAATR